MTFGSRSAFQPFAVETSAGPHVTMQAGVLHAGRYWTSSARSATKVAALRRRRFAAVLMVGRSSSTIAAGPVTILDPLRPLDAFGDPLAAASSGPALLRLGLTYPEQIVGYVRTAPSIPTEWWPLARVVIVAQTPHRVELLDGRVVSSCGAFDRPPARLSVSRAVPIQPELNSIPAHLGQLVSTARRCALGVMTGVGSVVLPGGWHFADGTVTVSRDALELIAPTLPGPCCITIDSSDDAQPNRKSGVMLRGRGALVERDGNAAVLAVAVERTTHWDGFDTSTYAAA